MQATREPFRRQPGDLFQRARLFEEVGCPRNHGQLLLTAERFLCFPVELQHVAVFTAHNQQRGSRHLSEPVASQVRTTSTGNHRSHMPLLGGSNEGSGGSGACPEEADRQV